MLVWGTVTKQWGEFYTFAFVLIAALSAFLWWYLVEQNPERRAYYD